MKKVSFEGFMAEYLTFRKDENAQVAKGDFVSLSAEGKVCASVPGEIFGRCTDIRGDFVTVQVKGYMKAKVLSGQSIAPGRSHIGLDADGKIKILSTAPSLLVTEVDTENGTIGFIL